MREEFGIGPPLRKRGGGEGTEVVTRSRQEIRRRRQGSIHSFKKKKRKVYKYLAILI